MEEKLEDYEQSTFKLVNTQEEEKFEQPLMKKNAYERSLEIGQQLKNEPDKPLKIEGASHNCKKCYGKGYIGFFSKIGEYDLSSEKVPVICSCVEKNEQKLKDAEKDLSDKIF